MIMIFEEFIDKLIDYPINCASLIMYLKEDSQTVYSGLQDEGLQETILNYRKVL